MYANDLAQLLAPAFLGPPVVPDVTPTPYWPGLGWTGQRAPAVVPHQDPRFLGPPIHNGVGGPVFLGPPVHPGPRFLGPPVKHRYAPSPKGDALQRRLG